MGSQTEGPAGPDLGAGVSFASLPEGIPVLGHVGADAVLLVRRGETVFATGASCTHYGGPLVEGLVVGETVRCPLHHACFSLRTGEALGAPALSALACYEVLRDGDTVRLGRVLPAATRSLSEAARAAAPSSIVVVGAGAAGAAAVETLRREGYSGPVTLVGGELPGPVDRPNLSKDYLAGTAPEEWIPLRPPDFYRELDVELVVDDAARAVLRGLQHHGRAGVAEQHHQVTEARVPLELLRRGRDVR
ncbi:MAG TPA: Rieske 2Fe-2S domain-containing protein, partial [Myxococcota bacterium]|nr:Rieske 2Fe-2S domain-containing protein [Myxococcota bacterium]